jgi:hypothetical protein
MQRRRIPVSILQIRKRMSLCSPVPYNRPMGDDRRMSAIFVISVITIITYYWIQYTLGELSRV